MTMIQHGNIQATVVQLSSGGYCVEWYTDDDAGSGYGEHVQVARWYGTCQDCERIARTDPCALTRDERPQWHSLDLACERRHMTTTCKGDYRAAIERAERAEARSAELEALLAAAKQQWEEIVAAADDLALWTAISEHRHRRFVAAQRCADMISDVEG